MQAAYACELYCIHYGIFIILWSIKNKTRKWFDDFPEIWTFKLHAYGTIHITLAKIPTKYKHIFFLTNAMSNFIQVTPNPRAESKQVTTQYNKPTYLHNIAS